MLAGRSDFCLLFVAEDTLGWLPPPSEKWRLNKNYSFFI